MNPKVAMALGAGVIVLCWALWFTFLRGDGGFKRMITLTGVYAVCHPGKYPYVCFLEAGHDAISCQRWDEECK